MAPTQTRKRTSDQMEDGQQNITPTGSPARKRTKITQSQKQALIDNLQLEITERARGLRAHYALQCVDLRARIERRINRIPMALRKANMGELLAKHTKIEQPKPLVAISASQAAMNAILPSKPREHQLPPAPRSPNTKLPSPIRPVQQHLSPTPRGKKRKTSEIIIAADKESESEQQNGETHDLAVQKNPKRTKTAPGGHTRNISRGNKPGNVLSPKSHNSRTLPHSPIQDFKPAPSSPNKPSYIARPVSPLKPTSPLKSAASAATSAISASIHGMMEHAKRGGNASAAKTARMTSQEKQAALQRAGKMPPPPRPVTARSASVQSTSSSGSAMSTSTTVVVKKGTGLRAATKAVTGGARKAPTIKASAMKKETGVTGISAAGKKVVVAEPAAGRRVLRKRN